MLVSTYVHKMALAPFSNNKTNINQPSSQPARKAERQTSVLMRLLPRMIDLKQIYFLHIFHPLFNQTKPKLLWPAKAVKNQQAL